MSTSGPKTDIAIDGKNVR